MDIYVLTGYLSLLTLASVTAIHKRKLVVNIALIGIGINLILCITYWIINKFSGGGFNTSALHHLHHVLDFTTLQKFWKMGLFAVTSLLTVLLLFLILKKSYSRLSFKTSSALALLCTMSFLISLGLAFWFNPLVQDSMSLYREHRNNLEVQLPEHLSSINALASIEVAAKPDIKNDLVVLYAEGLERLFFEDSVFPGLTPNLSKLIFEKGHQIRGIKDLVLSNWTHSGMTAAMCGLSMAPNYSRENKTNLNSLNLVGETCIGDFLSNEGYHLSFYGGSQFSDTEKTDLYQYQGFNNIWLENDFEKIFPTTTPRTTWGYHDDELLEHSLREIKKRESETQPQANFILTLDTHNPGLPSPSCESLPYRDGKDKVLNAVHCTDSLVAEFIKALLDGKASSPPTVVLLSDHLHAGPQDIIDNTSRESREYLFVVFNPHPSLNMKASTYRPSVALDIAPSLLAILGYEVETLNLGRNIFSDKANLVELLGRKSLVTNIPKIRKIVNDDWIEKSKK